MSPKTRFTVVVGTVTAVVVGTLVALWRGGELSSWHIVAGTAIALTALLKNLILYRNSFPRDARDAREHSPQDTNRRLD